MSNTEFHTAISNARYFRYLNACGAKNRALELYKANIILSQKLYSVIGIFEIILRNSIDRHMIVIHGETWLEDAVQPGGFLDINAGCEDSYHSVQEVINKLGAEYTHDRVISKLTFGFWTYQFASKEFAASGSTMLETFRNRPKGTRQKKVFQSLIKINDIRNRIAHHEPICFDKADISVDRTERRYEIIIDLLSWLGCNPVKILDGIDDVKDQLKIIRAI